MKFMRRTILLACSAAALVVCPNAGAVELPKEARIGNQFVERKFAIQDGHVRTLGLLNKLDQRWYALDSDEFEIELVWERLLYWRGEENPLHLTSRDFVVRDVIESTPAKGQQQLVFQMANQRFGLDVRLVFTVGAQDRFLRKHLEIRSSGKSPVFVNQVAVERFRLPGAELSQGGFGQPLYADNVFFGVEYPASYNLSEGGSIRCYYYLGVVTTNEWLRTENSVMGVAAEGAIRRAFLDYVGTIRSGKVRFTNVFNTWFDMQQGSLTDANSLERMATLKSKLLDPYGLPLDSFVLDDGWDDLDHLWQIDPAKFKGDFSQFRKSIEASGSRLGLWYGPVGGYEPIRLQRIKTGRRDGYEITANGAYFCIAGTRYFELLKQNMLAMVRKYHVNHFKLDGIPFGCNAQGHGHLPGIFAREAQVRAFIDILTSLRATDPDVFLNFTTGDWLSPWWLKYADVAFINGMDYGFLDDVPSVSERDKAISYRDTVMFDDFRRHADQFPVSSAMTIGLIKGTLGAEGGLGESLDSFTNAVIMNYSRGTMLNELYISPAIFKDEEWRVLGGAMQWARSSSDVLLGDTRFILGDPARREVYGYAHFVEDRGIVTVRNPYIEPKTVAVALDRSSGLEPTASKFRARIVFPYNQLLAGSFSYGDSIPLTVEGYQIVIAQLEPEGGQVVATPAAGLRYDIDRAGKLTTYDPDTSGVGQVQVQSLEFSAAKGSFTLDIPKNARNVRLAVLCQTTSETARLAGKLTNNGAPLSASLVSARSSEEGLGVNEAGGGHWAFLVAPLEAANNHLTFEILDGKNPFTGEVSVWLLSDFQLEAGKTIDPPPKQAHVQQLPVDSSLDYRSIQLFTRRF